MKKIAIYMVIITIGVLLSFPMVSGIKLKEAYLQRIGSMPQQPGITLHNESYERGWFRSTAVIRVELDLAQLTGEPSLADKPLDLLVRSDFHHGPVLLTDMGLRFGLGYGSLSFSGSEMKDAEKVLTEWMAAAPLTIRTLINFDQSAHTELNIEPYASDQGDDHIRFGGISATLMSDGSLTHFDGTLVVNASSILTTGFALNLGESSGSMSYQGDNPYTMVGETVFNIPSLSVTGKDMSMVLQGVNLNGGTQLNQGKLDYFQTVEIENIESQLPVTAGSWHLEFTGISPEGLEAWSDFTTEMQAQFQTGALAQDDTGEPQLTPEMEARLEQVVNQLLQPGLGFSQRLSVKALGETHNADMELSYIGLPAGGSLLHVANPKDYIPAFKGGINVLLHEQAIMDSPMADTVMPLVQQGLLLPKEGKLVLEARLEQGELLLNGSPVPLDALLQSAMQPVAEETAEALTSEQQ